MFLHPPMRIESGTRQQVPDFFIFVENGGCMTVGEFLFGYGLFSPGYILACLLLWAYVYWRTGGRNGKNGK